MKKILNLHPNVVFLGIVSFLTDISSELIFTLMPLFLLNVLGTATLLIGTIEGVAESTASLLKVFSGLFSDRLGKRKLITLAGYTVSTVAKPFMLIASSWGIVLGVRFSDRFGKGIRSAPRDALIADSLNSNERGKGFGFHRTMDTSGAAMGLIIAAIVVFSLQSNNLILERGTYQSLIITGIIPAILALLLFFFIKDVKGSVSKLVKDVNSQGATVAVLNNRYKIFLGIIFIFTLGNSSDAFLILRAQNLDNSVLNIILMLIVFNLVYALVSTPAGALSDKLGRKAVLALGWFIYAITYLGLALASESWQIWLCLIFYGIYYGISEGVARAFVADLVPVERRGTAYGIFHGLVGITLLPASIIAGWLWQQFSPAVPFYLGAGLSGVAMVLLIIFVRK